MGISLALNLFQVKHLIVKEGGIKLSGTEDMCKELEKAKDNHETSQILQMFGLPTACPVEAVCISDMISNDSNYNEVKMNQIDLFSISGKNMYNTRSKIRHFETKKYAQNGQWKNKN